GTKEAVLKKIVFELGIENVTIFTGFIDYDEIPKYHNMIDISVFVSIDDSESFGVSVLEAMACAKPVIVSDAGGLPEVVKKNVTGLIVERKNSVQTSNAIEELLLNKDMRLKFGANGRERVKNKYSLEDSVSQMIKVYEQQMLKN
ncbi:MAG: glycosyltransferase family 4 protein, partial [Ignavibacteria bacterium CG_4_10_14_3_um_filter_37_18]